jgi:predicted PurR-regulated permease PerM
LAIVIGTAMSGLRLFAVLGSVFILGTVFYLLEDVLVPFIAAWVLAYLLVPLVDLLDSRVPRSLAIVVSFTTLGIVLAGVAWGVVPAVHTQISAFLTQLPSYAEQLDRIVAGLSSHFHVAAKLTGMSHIMEHRLGQLGTHVLQAPSELMSTAAQLVKTIVFIALVPIVAFFLLRDWHQLVQGLESFVRASRRRSIEQFVRTADEILRHYIHGQLLVMAAVGIMYIIGYEVTGISLALVLGLLAGVVFVIPFASFVLSGLPALLISIVQFHDLLHPLLIVLTIAISELVGNGLLTPLLVGRFVRVHPAAVLLFIFAGGALFGVLGMILALPLAAMATGWVVRLADDVHSAASYAPVDNEHKESGDC